MKHRLAILLISISAVALLSTLVWHIRTANFAILEPAGLIALGERTLMVQVTLLMLIVVVPVLILTFMFAWHYRASNKNAVYKPEWESSPMDELVWWAIPCEIILVLAALTWSSTHLLDPKRPIDSHASPLIVEVVALDWKWLFIYPEEGIATVNLLKIPADRPIKFKITSDAPMNSFWIPQLGGQIYAMTGMSTELNLIAEKQGDYQGLSANYSGAGFADMKFTTHVVSPEDFDAWVRIVEKTPSALDNKQYEMLTQPSSKLPPTLYGSVEKNLYNTVVGSYMTSVSDHLNKKHPADTPLFVESAGHIKH